MVVVVTQALARKGRTTEYLLTIQQYRLASDGGTKGIIDIPFWRMRSVTFDEPSKRRLLLERLNEWLPQGSRIREEAVHNGPGHFGAIAYPILYNEVAQQSLVADLEWALTRIRTGQAAV